jgi:hypothetical protein
VYSNSEFKYQACRVSGENDRFRWCDDILYRDNHHCKCPSCPICLDYYSWSIHTFFSERIREHYDELKNNVFRWLDNLHLGFFDETNVDILPKIYAQMGKDSMFYDDAKKHMSRRMKENIEKFEKSLISYNEYIDSSNAVISQRIKEIKQDR